MVSGVEVLEERLKSFLCQLQAESGILDRIIYKNKNQHRRCSYFQFLLKVRRDLKLLLSIHIEELLDSCFNVITGRKAKQKAHLLESLKKSKCDNGNFNFLLRLLGAARLLSEMVEPMLKAAVDISTLLARSFFMGFSLMVLALLARTRVLVQQVLLDVVSVFNDVSSIAQKKQSIKITQNGIEVFREYYPAMNDIITLECVWKIDKFVLAESINKVEIRHQDGNLEGGQTLGTPLQYQSVETFLGLQDGSLEGGQTLGTPVQYQSVETFLGGDELNSKDVDGNIYGEENVSKVKKRKVESSETLWDKIDGPEQVQFPSVPENDLEGVIPRSETTALGGTLVPSSSISAVGGTSVDSSTTCSALGELRQESVSNKRVAFISVKQPSLTPSVPNASTFQVDKGERKSHDDEESPLFCIFNNDDVKSSIF